MFLPSAITKNIPVNLTVQGNGLWKWEIQTEKGIVWHHNLETIKLLENVVNVFESDQYS